MITSQVLGLTLLLLESIRHIARRHRLFRWLMTSVLMFSLLAMGVAPRHESTSEPITYAAAKGRPRKSTRHSFSFWRLLGNSRFSARHFQTLQYKFVLRALAQQVEIAFQLLMNKAKQLLQPSMFLQRPHLALATADESPAALIG
jgi:hypothetical protein